VPLGKVRAFAEGLLSWIEKLHKEEILEEIKKTKDFTDKVEGTLRSAIGSFKESGK
jgi:F0F1-type ATP synthase alpha subunit